MHRKKNYYRKTLTKDNRNTFAILEKHLNYFSMILTIENSMHQKSNTPQNHTFQNP